MVHALDIILSGLNDQVLQSSSGPIVIFQILLQLSRYSLDGWELDPWTSLQTHRGFYFTIHANNVAQLFWQ